ncbi:MAG TPA: adenosine kinase [Acidimicrobiales bacterium]|nr:adenosine kinase [Acidimicrobiales bacterium]
MAGDPQLDVLAVGNALVDVLARAGEDVLDAQGLVKGSMQLVDAAESARLYDAMGPGVEASGGSAANTAVGVASLGGRSGFVGRVRDDPLGEVFTHAIRAAGVRFDTPPATSGEPTGRCLVLVTPDGERTMSTFLGAAAELAPSDIDPAVLGTAGVTFLEGYLWDPPEARAALVTAAEQAHAAGRRVAFTLSDGFLVDRYRAEFTPFVSDHVDITFANESEVLSLFETDDFDAAVGRLAALCDIAAVTRGEHGSVVAHGDARHAVAAVPTEVVDTTGAGDLYAAGFLFGLARGWELDRCAEVGGIAAAEVISHIGPRPLVKLADLL